MCELQREATMSQCNDLLRLIGEYEHRLNSLEEEAAAFNFHTPPHIPLEIEALEAKLRTLSAQFAELDCPPETATLPNPNTNAS
jgi:hypothetical protein